MEKETSCINSRAILNYLKAHDIDYAGMIKDLDPEIDGLEDPESFLRDPDNWISCGVVSRLFERATRLLDDDQTAYKMGRYVTENSDLGFIQRIVVKAFWSVRTGLRHCQKINDQWNRSKKVELIELKRNKATVRLHWDPGMETSKHLCQYNQAVYTCIPLIWGGSRLTLREKCCYFDGAPYCEYHLKWPLKNRFHEIISRFFTSKSVLTDTLEKIEKDRKIIDQKNDELRAINKELHKKIAEHKQAEEALRESDERYKRLFMNMGSGVAIYGVKGDAEDFIFMDFNKAAEKIDNQKKEDLIGRSIFEARPQVEQFGLIDVFREVWKTGKPMHHPITLYKDGKIKGWYENFVYKLSSDEIVAIFSNETDRRQAQEALRESEEKYRSMMEAMEDPVSICSPDYKIEFMNPAMIKRTGHDATGEDCFKALHDLDEKCSWCLHHKTQNGEHLTTEIVSPKDNRTYIVSHSPIFHGDGSISKMTIFRDATDFKKMETQLQQAQKMEAIGTLAGGIAHDFNNILFPMFGYLEMMLEDVSADNPLRGRLAEVFNGAKRARDLVKQILTFSRQTESEKKPLKVPLVIKEVLKLIRSSLPTTIDIHQDISNECELVMADPSQIHQIAMNLITNAYHAMEGTGGKLTVNLKEVELTAEDSKDPTMIPGSRVCLTVADTGPGIDQGIIARIFDPYFTTKEKDKGTGLGLAVVHGIVKSHGGHISVYSEPGEGTEFQVYLPVIKSRETAQKNETDLPIQKGNERILLVDDQDMIVQIERKMLERLGYHVTARTGSTDALEAFRMQPDKFDLVITDMTMPNMTGDKLAGELIKIRSDIPVILCTGFSEGMTEERAAFLGIKGFLIKPVVIRDLSKTIRDVLDNK